MMKMIRELLRMWRRYRLVHYIEDQREYQRQSNDAADDCLSNYNLFVIQSNKHAHAARRAEIELEEFDNGRI